MDDRHSAFGAGAGAALTAETSAATGEGGEGEMSRDQILAHFQELTALENIDECLALLESTNWNLEQAIQLHYSGGGGVVEHSTGTGASSFNPFSQVNAATAAANEDDYVNINGDQEAITIEDDDETTTTTTTEKPMSAFNVPKTDLFNSATRVSVSGRSKSGGGFSISTTSSSSQAATAANSSSLLEHLDRYQSSATAYPPLSSLRPTSVNQIGDDLAAYLLNDNSSDSATAYPHKRLLAFEIEYKHKRFQLHLNDDDTVRKLKELISEELAIPVNHVTLKGWKQKDLRVSDYMKLRELNLPRETSLFVINTDQSNIATATAGASSSSAARSFELLIFLLETNSSPALSLDHHDLEIDGADNDAVQGKRTSYRLKFDASTKFLEIKRAIAKLSHVVVVDQEWWAFSKNYVPDQSTFLLNPFSSVEAPASTTTTDLYDPATATSVVKTSANSTALSNNNKYFQDLLANNVLYSMPLSILEPDNLTLADLRSLISTVLDPDNGLSKTATSWSSSSSSSSTSNEVSSSSSSAASASYFHNSSSTSSSSSKGLFNKNSKLTPPIFQTRSESEIKMSFVVTTRPASVNTQESGKSGQATSSGVRTEPNAVQTPLGFDFLTTKSLEQHSPLKRAKYSGLGGGGGGVESPGDDDLAKGGEDFSGELHDDADHMNVDDDDDDEDEIDDQWVLAPSTKQKPLIPDECPDDELLGTNYLVEEFAQRYGPIIPLFFIGTLEDAIKEALLCPAKDRKLLCIYLHSDATVFCNIFCAKALCDEHIINYLASSCTVWPWDLTQKKRERYFNEKCSKHLGSVFASTICNSKKLPALVVVTRVRGTNEVLGVIEGDSPSDLMLDRLMQYYELFDAQRVKDERDEMGREERERIKREQDTAYQMSLENDKAKRARQAEENEKQQKAAEQERLKAEAKDKYRRECLANLPAEPDESVPSARVARIRFRLPSGETLQRKFNVTDKLKALIDFAIGNDYSIDEYKILSSWPRRDLTNESPDKTFEELKLFPQETVTLEQR